MVYKAHAVARQNSHFFWKAVHQEGQVLFVAWLRGIVNKNYAIGVLFNCRPRLFVLLISGNIPEFDVKLSKRLVTARRVSLEVHNPKQPSESFVGKASFLARIDFKLDLPDSRSRPVNLRRAFLNFAQDV